MKSNSHDDLLDGSDGEEEEKIDPRTLMPDLYTAAKENNAEKVLELLEMEVPPLHANKSIGWTALHWASFHGNVQMTRDLLQKGASEPYHRALKKAGLVDVKVVKKKNERRDAKNADGEINANQQEEVDQEEEEEDENGVGFELPEHLVGMNYLTNTPLLWTVYKNQQGAMWLLLADGYSPNDTDSLGNNCLHLAACTGNRRMVDVMMDLGTKCNQANAYTNTALDMATGKELRSALRRYRKESLSWSDGAEGAAQKQIAAVEAHEARTRELVTALAATAAEADPSITNLSADKYGELIARTEELLSTAVAENVEQAAMDAGRRSLEQMRVAQMLREALDTTRAAMPITDEKDLVGSCVELQAAVDTANALSICVAAQTEGTTLLVRARVGVFLKQLTLRLQDVVKPVPYYKPQMDRLAAMCTKAEVLGVHTSVIAAALSLHTRLDAELKITTALSTVLAAPRLPLKEGAEYPPDYWSEGDVGRVVPAIGFHPLPDPDKGEYEWEPSETFRSLSKSVEELQGVLQLDLAGAGVAEDLIASATEALAHCSTALKKLQGKNENDKLAAIEVVQKEAKKLKKGKKGKK